MDDVAPFDFDAVMSETVSAATSESTTGKQAGLTPVRYFTKAGIEQVEELLKTIRTDKTLHKDDVEALLEDPMYAKELSDDYKIDRSRVFATKLELCDYFIPLFGKDFLEQNRKNAGLWTWLALAYYQQFVKTKKDVITIASTARWIFDHENYRLSVRHFVAGPVYLNYDFYDTSVEVKDMLFSSPPKEFGGFVDAITYKMEGTRLPVLMQVAAWLYHDPSSQKKMKKGTISQDKPGTVREFLRVSSQFAETRDFYGVEDAHELWSILPKQFSGFKGGAEH